MALGQADDDGRSRERLTWMAQRSIDAAVTLCMASACANSGRVGVAFADGRILIKDTKHIASAVLTFDTDGWGSCMADIKASPFDPPTSTRARNSTRPEPHFWSRKVSVWRTVPPHWPERVSSPAALSRSHQTARWHSAVN
jgi:hypothetical protein